MFVLRDRREAEKYDQRIPVKRCLQVKKKRSCPVPDSSFLLDEI
jgi:hypothetical protein